MARENVIQSEIPVTAARGSLRKLCFVLRSCLSPHKTLAKGGGVALPPVGYPLVYGTSRHRAFLRQPLGAEPASHREIHLSILVCPLSGLLVPGTPGSKTFRRFITSTV